MVAESLAESLVEAFDSSKGLIKVQAGAPLEPLKYSSGSAQGASTQTQGPSKLNATHATQAKNASTQQMPASSKLSAPPAKHASKFVPRDVSQLESSGDYPTAVQEVRRTSELKELHSASWSSVAAVEPEATLSTPTDRRLLKQKQYSALDMSPSNSSPDLAHLSQRVWAPGASQGVAGAGAGLAGAERAGAVTDGGTGVIEDKGGGSKCPFAALLAQEGGEV